MNTAEEKFDLTPSELKEKFDRKDRFLLLDVREPDEYAFVNLGGLSLPLAELTSRYGELDPDRETIVLCHHGVRSAHATLFLRSQGFRDVKNLRGGIDRWTSEVDPSLPRY